MKKIKAFRVDEELYNEFKIYTIMINSSISKELEKFMKQTLEKMKK